MDIENMSFSKIQLNKKTWSKPFKFRIRKDDISFRTLQIPNIYNFKLAYDYYNNELQALGYNFENLENLDDCKRMEISYVLGEFKENNYDKWLLKDYKKLVEYDILIKCDIKSFYDNIYTHYIFKDDTNNTDIDKPLSHMNNGRTGGIIMGNYISLYVAEVFSKKLSFRFKQRIRELGLNCDFSYFSDDFYIYTYKEDKDKVLYLFDEVLEEFSLEKNEDKVEFFDYLKYTGEDVIEKYWKIITTLSQNQQANHKEKIRKGDLQCDYNLFFTNQLIYRLNKLENYKKRRIFIVNFFKSEFFQCINFSKTCLLEYNYHQILYLIKEFPEIVLYINNILKEKDFYQFRSGDFIKKIIGYYERSLNSNFHDEQLYFFYLIYKLNALNLIKNEKLNEKLLKTKNYILISYYISNEMFNSNEMSIIKNYNDESYWLVFYYLILNDEDLYNDLENSVLNYLVPKSASVGVSVAYKEFYFENLSLKNEILVGLNKIDEEIEDYFRIKYPNMEQKKEENIEYNL